MTHRVANSSAADSEAILERGRRAAKILFVVNSITALVAAGLGIAGLKAVALLLAFVIFGLQLLFLVTWFIPALIYQYVVKRRSLRESAAWALWSFVEVLKNPSF